MLNAEKTSVTLDFHIRHQLCREPKCTRALAPLTLKNIVSLTSFIHCHAVPNLRAFLFLWNTTFLF